MSFQDRGANWFLVQLKPNSATIADRNLKRQGFRTFLPVEDVTRRARSRFVTTEHPVFQGYIFVMSDAARGGWRAINCTSGITRLVSFGGAPRAVPDGIVSGLMLRCDMQGKFMPPERLKPGA